MRKDEFPIVDKLVKDSINDALDKIRAEIEENIQECVDENKYLIATGLGNALNIIDKYRKRDKE